MMESRMGSGLPADPDVRFARPTRAARAAVTVACIASVACGTSPATERPGARPSDAGGAGVPADSPHPSLMEAGAEPLPGDAGTAIVGTVLDFGTGRPLSGLTVVIAGVRAVTDSAGRFTVETTAPSYDVLIYDADASSLSVFRGVRRRDPVLPHRPSRPSAPSSTASVTGSLSGGAIYPSSSSFDISVYFFSSEADQSTSAGGALSTDGGGPAFGPLEIGWSGANTIDGKLVAVGSLAGGDGGPAGTWIANQPLTLASDQAATQVMALSPASPAGTLAGTITLPAGLDLVEKQLFLRLPIVHASIPLAVPQDGSSSFSLTVPDLSALGGELCVGAVASPGPVSAEICGVTAGDASVKLDLAPPPSFVLGDGGASLTSSGTLSWTSAGPGVFLFELTSENPSAQVPNVYVFTTDGSAGWPDLTAAGVSFPEGIEYNGSVATMGSYPTMDEALGPDGMANPFPTSLQRSYSAPVPVETGR